MHGLACSLEVLAGVVLGEIFSELGELVVAIHLCQQALQHQGDVLLVVDAVDELDGNLEVLDGLLDIVARVGVVAVDLAELLEDESSGALLLDHRCIFAVCYIVGGVSAAQSLDLVLEHLLDEAVDSDRLIVEALLLEHIAKLVQHGGLLKAESKGTIQGEAGLLETLPTVLEAQDCVEAPDAWVQIVEDVGLCDGVFGGSKLSEAHETEAEEDPRGGGHSLLAHLHEDGLGVLPRLALRVDDT